MGRKETVELTNMCMVEDGKGNVLVQNRLKQFWLDDGVRYIVFLFRADKFTGELHGSEEGDAFWLPRAELFEHQTAESFEGLVHVFETPECSEVYCKDGETHFA